MEREVRPRISFASTGDPLDEEWIRADFDRAMVLVLRTIERRTSCMRILGLRHHAEAAIGVLAAQFRNDLGTPRALIESAAHPI